jgi:hypothetical protein
MGKFYRLTEDLEMQNDFYGVRTGGGVAKAGQLFELVKESSPEKKLYQLDACGVKFPYTLRVRPNVFKKYFTEVEGA